ncbi:MAG: rhomboid family intramembrane serine protease [Deltaproteobacteria bacterium]|nr:rhomboid family intramembrane serine protease [Deltaproteobacteria bacterium]
MILPIGDTPNPRNYVPWVNYALIAANVGLYVFWSLPLSYQPVDPADPLLRDYLRLLAPSLPAFVSVRDLIAQISAYDLFIFVWGYKPAAPELADLLLSMFLHANVWHLAGNMLFLWIFGDNVEHRLGRIGYLLTYLGSGILATLAFCLLARGSMTPLVGASGAISGVMGVYFLLFPRNQVKLFVFLFFFLDVWLLPARWVLGFLVVADNLLPLLLGSQSGVAYGAHLGGFAAGLGLAWAGERLGWRGPWAAGPRLGAGRPAGTGPLDAVRESLKAGRQAEALERLAALDGQGLSRLEPDECVQLAAWLEAAGHDLAATRLLRRCLAAHQASGDLARVLLALGKLRLQQGQPTAAYQFLLDALDHDPDPETEAMLRRALAAIQVYRRR